MRFSPCKGNLFRFVLALIALSASVASLALAEPGRPRKPGGFHLFASAELTLQTNRIACHIGSDGQLCASGSSTVGGGIWPKGTSDQYIFATGLQIAGVVDDALPKSQNGFAGDTAGAFFYNTALGGGNGLEVRPIFSSTNPADVASWPDEARVPCSPATNAPPLPVPPARCVELGLGGDASGDLFNPALQGSVGASQGDNWFMYWEGDPSQLAGPRAHPLGILVETRALAWNFPSGNEDIMYFAFTFYNVTSANAAAYQNIRSSVRDLVAQKGQDFVALNSAKYGINLPADGYTIKDIFVAIVADNDVAQADANFASVNVPFALGYTYVGNFTGLGSWTFDPAIFGSAPFFPGAGFIGLKYLSSPIDPATGQPVGLTLFGTFSRSSGALQDPADDKQLYRYVSGTLTPSDGACNVANFQVEHICFVNLGAPADMRQFQSSGPFDLAPGQSGTIVVAYINAPPVADGNCPGVGCLVLPADGGNASRLTILGDAARMAGGVNRIDRMTGFVDFNDANGDGRVTQEEFVVQPGSLLGKSLVAQSVFNNKFLLPFSPEAPGFFLVPGDAQVTIFWTRSATETTPDPFFAVASSPTTTVTNPDGTTSEVVNPLYDPNFRDLDVEGYRIYRGRVSNPSELTLIAQFDYAPDPFTPTATKGRFKDFRGTVNPTSDCAPEIGVLIACPVPFTVPPPGQPFTVADTIDLVGTITQIVPGNRVLLADGKAQVLPGKQDTAFADINQGKLAAGVSTVLTNSGVPFVFTDHGVRNSLRYFYSVTSFDVNSAASGPSSLESARITKPVTPTPTPNNIQATVSAVTTVLDRDGTPLTNTAVPSIDPATGKFSGPFPPANGGTPGLAVLMSQVLGSPATFAVKLDSMALGESGDVSIYGASPTPQPHIYYFTAKPGTPEASAFSVPVVQTAGGSGVGSSASDTTGVGFFSGAAPIDPATSSQFEGGGGFSLSGKLEQKLPSNSYLTGQGLGCANGDPGFTPAACAYNGARWFDGPSPTTNETKNDPNAGNSSAETVAPTTDFNNAGQLTGVTVINEAHAYTMFDRSWRNVEWAVGGAARAADFNVYWSPTTAGLVDSVIDITHNVVVPFDTIIRANWGILNTANTGGGDEFDGQPTLLTHTDMVCVEPLRSVLPGQALRIPCSQAGVFTSPPYKLSNTAQLGSIGFASGAAANTAAATPAAQPGFLFYLAGHQFLMQMPALPTPGTVWALRTYTGAISGGNGAEGAHGPYSFTPAVRPFTAVGAQTQVTISAATVVAAATAGDLSKVHTVPDPYYVQSKYEVSTDQKVLKFVNLPQDCIIRIYTASGVLVRVLEHHAGTYSSTSNSQGSQRDWDLRNRNNQVVASGVYFWHLEAGGQRKLGRFTVVNFTK